MVDDRKDPLGTLTGWIEVELGLDPRLADPVSALLFSKGATGAEEMDPDGPRARIRAWFPVSVEPQSVEIWLSEMYRNAREAYGDLVPARISVKSLEEKDWAESWKSCFAPLRIGRTLRIVPTWIEPETDRALDSPDARIVRLDPGMAFGTGTHPTTFMCLEHLESLARETGFRLGRVWDWGAGSGILGISARLLGADSVLGTDTSPQAVEAATDNARLNGLSGPDARIEFTHRPVAKVEGPFDLVLANLYAEVLLRDMETVLAKIAPGGSFICSGFVAERAAEIEGKLREAGFSEVRKSRRSDSSQLHGETWAGLWWRKPK